MASLGYCGQCGGVLHVRGDVVACGVCGLPRQAPPAPPPAVPPPAPAVQQHRRR